MTELRDKQCFITGAANGIGRALAYAAARARARLVLVDIDGPALDAVAADLRTTGASVLAAEPLDVADTPAVSAFADHVLAVHGSMDVVMNVAGIAIWGEITALRHERWRRVVDVNLMGPIHARVAPGFRPTDGIRALP